MQAVVELRYAVGGVVHRGAGVEQEISAQIGFVFVLFDEVTVEFAERLPVDAADFIARRILAVLFELDAKAFGAALVHAGQQSLNDPAGAQRKVGDARRALWGQNNSCRLLPCLEIIWPRWKIENR